MKWLRKAAEKYLERYKEGPEPPERLREMVVAFANTHPNATRMRWVEFAAEHAGEAYRSGYTRGYEYVERVPELWRPDIPPEDLADMIDPDWKWQEGIQLTPGRDPGEETGEELERLQIEEIIKNTARSG